MTLPSLAGPFKKIFLLLLLLLPLVATGVEKRVALVIGNDNYQHIEKLRNAANDSRLIAQEFRALGFEVIHYENLNQKRMKSAVRDLMDKIAGGGIGAFYFAGHGIQEGGNNYLLPVDIEALADSSALADEAVELGSITERLASAKAKFSLLVIDACRNNPFPRKAGRGIGATRGLSPVSTPEGMIVIYSAGVGQEALDSSDNGNYGLFTSEFVKELRKPGIHVAEMVQNVRETVKEKAAREKHEQSPAIYIQAGKVYLGPEPGQEPSPAALPAATPGANSFGIPAPPAGSSPSRPVQPRQAAVRQAGEQRQGVFSPPQKATRVAAAPDNRNSAGKSFRDCAACPEMVVISAGSFSMGSPAGEPSRFPDENPQHRVGIPRSLAVGKFEIKRSEWAAFIEATGFKQTQGCNVYGAEKGAWAMDGERAWHSPGFGQTDAHPAVCISWHDANEYVTWLSGKTGKAYRLLSEAEWEYAARAATTRQWSDDPRQVCRSANVGDHSLLANSRNWKWISHDCDDGAPFTSAAGRYPPNPFGLHDMLGNAMEWTADCWHDNYAEAPNDGSAWVESECTKRVVRGGSWAQGPWVTRTAYRDRNPASRRSSHIGFRVARALD